MAYTGEEKKAYEKEWREKNKEKAAEIRKKHYQKNREKYLELRKQYRLENIDKISEDLKVYYENNKESLAIYHKERYKTHGHRNNKEKQKEWRLKNIDIVKEKSRKYIKENKEKILLKGKQWYSENRESIRIRQSAGESKRANELAESYVLKLILRSVPGIKREQVSQEIIELKRILIKTERLCRQLKN